MQEPVKLSQNQMQNTCNNNVLADASSIILSAKLFMDKAVPMRRSLSLLLTLFLLLGQQGTLLHTVSHLTSAAVAAIEVDDGATDPSKQKASACSLCTLAGQYAAALPYSLTFLPATYSLPALHAGVSVSVFRSGTTTGFDSRAPPLV